MWVKILIEVQSFLKKAPFCFWKINFIFFVAIFVLLLLLFSKEVWLIFKHGSFHRKINENSLLCSSLTQDK